MGSTPFGSTLSRLAADAIRELRESVALTGYALRQLSMVDPARGLRKLARAFGPPAIGASHVIGTSPAERASRLKPFNRPEAIGWHNDFSTQAHRPTLSLAYIERADPRGPEHGAWRVASCDRVLDKLGATTGGRRVTRLLTTEPFAYSFTGDGEPSYFHPIKRRGPEPGRLGLRFYGRAMRDGARLVHGRVPDDIEHAIRAVETAADEVGLVLPATPGALLVVDNWHCLHDRLAQSVDTDLPLRRSLLCFVQELDEPLAGKV